MLGSLCLMGVLKPYMDQSTRTYVINQYNSLITHKANSACIKLHYKYNTVNVNLYIDAYDPNSVALSMVLILDKKYYFTALNILNTGSGSEFLKEIPSPILSAILDSNNKLTSFFNEMERQILQGGFIRASYKKDTYFKNTLAYNNNDDAKPFWQGLRNVHMPNSTVDKLLSRGDISRETLLKIQDKGFTLVRTSDYNRRKQLKLILDGAGIDLS